MILNTPGACFFVWGWAMATRSYKFQLRRGDTKRFDLSFKSRGNPVNITGQTLWFTMKQDLNSPDQDADFQKSVVFPDNADSIKGIGSITIDSDESGRLLPGTYFFDMQTVIPGDPPLVSTPMVGIIQVLPDVTRRSGP